MKRYKIWIEGILGHEEQLRSYPTLEEAREQYGLMIEGAAAIALIEEDCKDGSTNLWVLDSYEPDVITLEESRQLTKEKNNE